MQQYRWQNPLNKVFIHDQSYVMTISSAHQDVDKLKHSHLSNHVLILQHLLQVAHDYNEHSTGFPNSSQLPNLCHNFSTSHTDASSSDVIAMMLWTWEVCHQKDKYWCHVIIWTTEVDSRCRWPPAMITQKNNTHRNQDKKKKLSQTV